MISVAECVGLAPYQSIQASGARDVSSEPGFQINTHVIEYLALLRSGWCWIGLVLSVLFMTNATLEPLLEHALVH